MSTQIYHEAESQRQFVRVRIPIYVEIDQARYLVDDWSVAGFGVLQAIKGHNVNDRFPARLIFTFENFELACTLESKLIYVDSNPARFGCLFVDVGPGQSSLLRHILDGYLAGEIVNAGDILRVVGRDSAAARQPAMASSTGRTRSAGAKIGAVLGSLVLLAAGAGLGYLAWLGIQERWLLTRAEYAVIEAPIFRVRAADAGAVERGDVPLLITAGEDIAAIRRSDGQSIPVASPCECTLVSWSVGVGENVVQGDTVAVLVAADRPLMVRARLRSVDASRLSPGSVAEIEVPGQSGTVRGTLERIDHRANLVAATKDAQKSYKSSFVEVLIRPETPLDFDTLGMTPIVTFR